ncbi:hypothetical protein C9J85_00945 [Haloferax sp. wsp5]|nr:hypothetical protein C9J85_00945 [Haloferax sp. wsp5]
MTALAIGSTTLVASYRPPIPTSARDVDVLTVELPQCQRGHRLEDGGRVVGRGLFGHVRSTDSTNSTRAASESFRPSNDSLSHVVEMRGCAVRHRAGFP